MNLCKIHDGMQMQLGIVYAGLQYVYLQVRLWVGVCQNIDSSGVIDPYRPRWVATGLNSVGYPYPGPAYDHPGLIPFASVADQNPLCIHSSSSSDALSLATAKERA